MNRICVLDVDLQGVRNIKKTDLRPIYISVQPPSLDVLVSCCGGRHGREGQGRGLAGPLGLPDPCCVLAETWAVEGTRQAGDTVHLILPVSQEQRLRQRNTETEESLAKRLAAARADMESSEWARLLSAALPRLHGGGWVAPGALWTVPMVTGAFACPPLQARSPACLT